MYKEFDRSEIKEWSGGRRGSIVNHAYNDIYRLAFGESGYLEHFYLLILDKVSGATDVRTFNSNTFLSEISHAKAFVNKDIYITANPLKKAVVSKAELSKIASSVSNSSDDIDTSLKYSGKEKKLYSCKKKTKGCQIVKRTNANIFSLRNIVIDVDFHGYDPDETAELIRNFENLFDELFEDVPMPNIIHNTGRGFQFWYALDETSVQLNWKYELVRNALIDDYNKFLKDNIWELDGATVDKAASSNLCGLFRLFGTYNSMAGAFSMPIMKRNTRYSLDLLAEMLEIKLYSAKEREQYWKEHSKRVACKKYFNGEYHNRRIDFLLNLITYRNALPGQEMRDYFIFHIYNELVQTEISLDEAKDTIIGINNNFKQPLSMTEVLKICRGVDKVGFYKYKTVKILENICATNEEIHALNFSYNCDHRSENRILKEKRNKEIIQLYRSGLKFAVIAKEVGCCLNTVKNIVHTYTDNIAQKIRNFIASRKKVRRQVSSYVPDEPDFYNEPILFVKYIQTE